MKRFIGNRQVNTPLVLMLLAVLTINNGWFVAQTGTHTNDLASRIGDIIETSAGLLIRVDDAEGGRWVPYTPKNGASKAPLLSTSPAATPSLPTQAGQPALNPGTPERKGEQVVVKEGSGTTKVEALKATKEDLDNFSVETVAKGSNGDVYEFTIKTECKTYGYLKRKICRVRAVQTNGQKKTMLQAHNAEDDKELENCDSCLNNVSLLDGEFSEVKQDADWILEVTDKLSQKFSDVIARKGKKKKKDGKGDDSGVSEEVRKKIYDCELAEGTTDATRGEEENKLKKDDKLACIEKRIEELGNADEKDKDPFGRKKTAVLTGLVNKVSGHLKKCLANEEHREDTGCLDLAESIEDSTRESGVKSVHNLSHKAALYIAQGNSTIEYTKYSDALKGLRAGMANATSVAERTGNFGPLQGYQNRLAMLHQQFMGTELRNAQFMRNIEMDPELMGMTDLGATSAMNLRLQQEFEDAATPSRFRNRMGMNGMMDMRMGIPQYGMNGMQIPPYGLNGMHPMMMNSMMRPPMFPNGPMGPMGIRPMGMNPMMPPPMMYNQGMYNQPFGGMYRPQYYGPQYGGPGYGGPGFGLNFNASFGILPTSGPYGQYGNWAPQRPMGPFAGGPYGGAGGPFNASPTAGYYPPTPFQSPTPVTTINTR